MADLDSKSSTIWIGALVGLAPAVLTFFGQLAAHGLNSVTLTVFLVSISLWPLAAIVLACRDKSHTFGLGMLLGVGVGWLVMVCICGGMIK
jgi:hypothetical protein